MTAALSPDLSRTLAARVMRRKADELRAEADRAEESRDRASRMAPATPDRPAVPFVAFPVASPASLRSQAELLDREADELDPR